MVKVTDVNKDIEAIAAETGVSVFTYAEIHNDAVNNKFHYDYNLVIGRYAKDNKISEQKAKEILIKSGILRMLPNGEYEINVGTPTRNGGGRHFGGSRVIFTYSPVDFHTKYHELAHSVQKKYFVLDRGYVGQRFEQMEREYNGEKFVSKLDFERYINEMHAEAFSFSALLLRAENKREFLELAAQIYNKGVVRTSGSILHSHGKADYTKNPHKFYATKQISYEVIKKLNRLRKEGKLGEFFRPDGAIDAKKLSDFCEKIVDEKAYSPRTLYAFFENDIFASHSSKEHGWRIDAAKSFLLRPVARIMLKFHDGTEDQKMAEGLMHESLLEQQEAEEKAFAAKRVVYKDPELMALREIQRLNTKLHYMEPKKSKLLRENLQSILALGISDEEINAQFEQFEKKENSHKGSKKERKERFVQNFNDVARLVAENADNPYFVKLINSEDEDVKKNFAFMLEKKVRNPEKSAIESTKLQEKRICKTQPQYIIGDFVKAHDLPDSYALELLDFALNRPEKLRDKDEQMQLIGKVQIKHDLFGIKKKRFAAELKEMLDMTATSSYLLHCRPECRESLLRAYNEKREQVYLDNAIQVIDEETMNQKRGIEPNAGGKKKKTAAPWIRGKTVNSERTTRR